MSRHGVSKRGSVSKFNRNSTKTRRENIHVARGGYRL